MKSESPAITPRARTVSIEPINIPSACAVPKSESRSWRSSRSCSVRCTAVSRGAESAAVRGRIHGRTPPSESMTTVYASESTTFGASPSEPFAVTCAALLATASESMCMCPSPKVNDPEALERSTGSIRDCSRSTLSEPARLAIESPCTSNAARPAMLVEGRAGRSSSVCTSRSATLAVPRPASPLTLSRSKLPFTTIVPASPERLAVTSRSSIVPRMRIGPEALPRKASPGYESANVVNDTGSACSVTSKAVNFGACVIRPSPVKCDVGLSPKWCTTFALWKRVSSHDESRTAVPETVPLSRGKLGKRYWIVRRSSVARSTLSEWNFAFDGTRMSSAPCIDAFAIAPGTCASWKVIWPSSMCQSVMSPPGPRTEPVNCPCQSTGNGPPANVRSRSKSSGENCASTFVMPSTGKPTTKVIAPVIRDFVDRMSILLNPYSSTCASRTLFLIVSSIFPLPVFGSVG